MSLRLRTRADYAWGYVSVQQLLQTRAMPKRSPARDGALCAQHCSRPRPAAPARGIRRHGGGACCGPQWHGGGWARRAASILLASYTRQQPRTKRPQDVCCYICTHFDKTSKVISASQRPNVSLCCMTSTTLLQQCEWHHTNKIVSEPLEEFACGCEWVFKVQMCRLASLFAANRCAATARGNLAYTSISDFCADADSECRFMS
eukprot:360946-Chlamydomonas_euryale.AAC.11